MQKFKLASQNGPGFLVKKLVEVIEVPTATAVASFPISLPMPFSLRPVTNQEMRVLAGPFLRDLVS